MTTEVKTKADVVEWWAVLPNIPKKEPTKGTIEFKSRKAARLFAEVLLRVGDATAKEDSRPGLQGIQMQTAKKGLRLASTDGFRLAVAEYRPGLRTAKDKESNILARPALFRNVSVLGIAKVLKRASPNGWATLEVTRDGKKRTLSAINDRGEGVSADELVESFPDWRKLPPTEIAAEPVTLSPSYLQWAGGFCEAINCEGGGMLQIRYLDKLSPARFDASSNDYRGMALVMPMWGTVQ